MAVRKRISRKSSDVSEKVSVPSIASLIAALVALVVPGINAVALGLALAGIANAVIGYFKTDTVVVAD